MRLGYLQRAADCPPIKRLTAYLNSEFYVWTAGAVFCVFYVLGLDLVNFYLLAAGMVFTFLFSEDIKPFFPLLALTPFAFSFYHAVPTLKESAYYSSPAVLSQLFVLLGVVVLAFGYRFIRNKMWKTLFTTTRLTYGFGFLALGLIMNGLASPGYTMLNLGYGVMIIAASAGLYFLLTAAMKWSKATSMRYFSASMFMTGVVIAIELLALYLNDPILRETFDKGHVLLGWGISNTIGCMLLLFLPFGLYLVHTSKRALPYLLLCSGVLAAVVFTFSRGSLVFAVPIMVGGLIYSSIDGKDRKTVLLFSLLVAAAAIAVWIVNSEKILSVIKFYIESGFDDNGRFDLWKDGFDAFKHSPIFGYGFNYKYDTLFPGPYYMHNTIFQFLYSCGIVGLGCYLYHRGETIFIMVRRLTVDRIFLGVALLALLGNGLIDVSMAHPLSLVFYGAILALAEKDYVWAAENAKNKKPRVMIEG